MKKVLMIGVLVGAFAIANAQDVIYFRNGAQQNGKVLQVGTNDVSYKKAENPNGPTYIINKSDVAMIEYQNGTQDLINSNNSNYNPSGNQQQTYNPQVYQQQNTVYAQPSQTYIRPQVNVIVPPVYNTWGNYYGYSGGYGYGRNYGYGGYGGGYGGGWGYSGHHHGGHHRW